MEPLARPVVDAGAEPLLQEEVHVHEFIKPELAGLVLVDEHINVGVRPRLVPRMRAEDVKRRDAARPEGGLGLLQGGQDVATAHNQ